MADNIQTFLWTGINRQGERLNGTIQAADTKAVESELKNRDIQVISIKPKQQLSLFSFKRKKIKTKEIVLFTQYLSTMLGAGMPILQALDVIIRDQGNELMRSVMMAIRTNVASGRTFADSLGMYPKYFPDIYTNLVRAGEKSGTLDKVLIRLSKYLEKIESIKRKVKNALVYPATIVSVAVFVSLILLIFVIPQFQTMYANAGAKLPYFTQLVVGLSTIIRTYWWLIIIAIFFLVYGLRSLMRTNEAFANMVDTYSLRIFVIGPIIQKAIIARFTRTLSITLDSGMPIVDAMKSMVNIMGNRLYSKAIIRISENIASGNPLSSSMETTKLFPNMVIQMVSVGEASGALGNMLNYIANYYEEEVNTIADNLSVLLEPVIIVILGIVIGAFVIAMYLPIFKLGTTI